MMEKMLEEKMLEKEMLEKEIRDECMEWLFFVFFCFFFQVG